MILFYITHLGYPKVSIRDFNYGGHGITLKILRGPEDEKG